MTDNEKTKTPETAETDRAEGAAETPQPAAETPAEEKSDAVSETQDAAETDEPADEADAPEDDKPLKGKERRALNAELKRLRAENESLTKKVADAEALAAETKDKYLRALAEYDNYRKRTARERDGIYSDAQDDCVKQLLPLFDNLERASQYTTGEQFVEGVKMILGTVPDILGRMNIEPFGAPGEKFDPNLHNAVMHVDDEEHGESEILEVFQCGYRHGDRVIRYAMVKVAN